MSDPSTTISLNLEITVYENISEEQIKEALFPLIANAERAVLDIVNDELSDEASVSIERKESN